MKKLMLAAAAGLLCFSQAAMAEIRTFEFTATVGNVLVNGNVVENYFGWDGSGKEVIVGDAIVGRFSFDDDAAPWGQNGDFVKAFAATMSFKLANGLQMGTTDGSVLAAANTENGMRSFSLAASPTGGLAQAALLLSAQGDPSLPYPSSFDGLMDRGFILNWGYENAWLSSTSRVNSITEVSAVPEPSTWCMLVGGLGLIGMAARRRRAT